MYGLPELNRERITPATKHIANPGCFATAIQLALLPLAKNGWLNADVHIHAVTGSTGAGVKPGPTKHYSWRNDNVSIYKPFKHQHLLEIRQSLTLLQPGFDSELDFIPMRGCFSRGIFATLYLRSDAELEDVKRAYEEYYAPHAFTFVTDKEMRSWHRRTQYESTLRLARAHWPRPQSLSILTITHRFNRLNRKKQSVE